MSYAAVQLIETKRDGGELEPEAIKWLLEGYTDGSVPDYQMSAMAMAILLNGMTAGELAAWTSAMLHSGDAMDFSHIAGAKVDKHSTGGVGDKVSIPLAPLVAACGVYVPMMSGRGLGHTGGTLDKLEAIAGFTTGLDPSQFASILETHGLVLAGQSESMVPADRKLYALRDVTGTVPSIPLISSSIMSKKLAEGLDGLLLDVKTGSGAFMTDLEGSQRLARTMVGIGSSYGVDTVALITSMDQPIGNEVGNACEIAESITVLRGEGPSDLVELTLAFGEVMLDLARIDGGRGRLEDAIADGSALKKFLDVTRAHGGDTHMIEDPSLLPKAPLTAEITAKADGYVSRCDALTIGLAATRLGAGRETKEDVIDPGVGITLLAKVGDKVAVGDKLAEVRYSDPEKWESQRDALESAWKIISEPAKPPDLIIDRLDSRTS